MKAGKMLDTMRFFLPYRSILIALPDHWTEDAENPQEFIRYHDPKSPDTVLKIRREDFRINPQDANELGMREFFGGEHSSAHGFEQVFHRLVGQLQNDRYSVDETIPCPDGSPLIRYRKPIEEGSAPGLAHCWVRGTNMQQTDFVVAFFSYSVPTSVAHSERTIRNIEMIERSVLACELLTLEQAVGLAAETQGDPLCALLDDGKRMQDEQK